MNTEESPRERLEYKVCLSQENSNVEPNELPEGSSIIRHIEFPIILALVFLALSISAYLNISLAISCMPLVIYELRHVFYHSSRYEWVGSLFFLSFYSLQILYFTEGLYFSVSIFPVFADRIFQSVGKKQSILVSISKWMLLIQLCLISLKVDYGWDLSLFNLFAGLWVILGFFMLTGVVLFLISLGSLVSYAEREATLEEVISKFWLSSSLLGFSCSFGYFLMNVCFSSDFYFSSLALSLFFSIFSVYTAIVYAHLEKYRRTEWGNRSSLPRKVIDTMKKPPKILLRLTKGYFKTIEENSMSLSRRIKSMRDENNIQDDSNNESSQILCEICLLKYPGAVFMDCGHGGICYDCAIKIWSMNNMCHVCRARIDNVLQVKNEGQRTFKVLSYTNKE